MKAEEVKDALLELTPAVLKLNDRAVSHLLGYLKGYSDRGEIDSSGEKRKETKRPCPKKPI